MREVCREIATVFMAEYLCTRGASTCGITGPIGLYHRELIISLDGNFSGMIVSQFFHREAAKLTETKTKGRREERDDTHARKASLVCVMSLALLLFPFTI